MIDVASVVRALARLYPWSVTASDDLDRSLGFLGADIEAEAVVRAGYACVLLCVPVVVICLSVVPDWSRGLVAVAGLVGAVGVGHAVHASPRLLATARRTRALGEAPALLSRAVARMRIEPAAESAAVFAAETGTGPLAASLGEHVRRAGGHAGSGLSTFGAEWEAWFPALGQALLLVESAGSATGDERSRTLDRGLEAVLSGARQQMATFAAALQGPATALYAFGVLLPLALVALLPAARMTGVSVPLSVIVILYDLVLPGVLVAASVWILVRRPVTFPPPSIDHTHPDLPDRRWPPFVAGLLVGVVGWAGSRVLVADWTAPLAAIGCGCGTALVCRYRPVKAVRDHVRAVESGLADGLYHVGRRVEQGVAVESAIETAADEVTDATGTVFADAARRQRQLQVGIGEAFLGERGALADVPSTRARTTASLLALAAREGRPAGGAILAMADNIDELEAVEREARREIGRITGTLANTAAVFGPLVAGATVALAAGTSVSGDLTSVSGPSTAGLGLAVGAYVLVLTTLLTVLSTGLARGFDRALLGYRVGWALLAATATYHVAFVAVGLFV